MGLLEFINADELNRIAELEKENKILKDQLILQHQYCKEQQEQDDYIKQLTQHLTNLEQDLTERTTCCESWIAHSNQLEQDFDKQLKYNDQLSAVCTKLEQQLSEQTEKKTSLTEQLKKSDNLIIETGVREQNKLSVYMLFAKLFLC